MTTLALQTAQVAGSGLLPSIAPLSAFFVAVAAFLGSMASAITGAGGAILISFAITPIIGVGAVVQTISVAMSVSHIARIQAFRADIDWPTATWVMLWSLPGCIIGSVIYTWLDERSIALLLGCFMLAVVIARRALPKGSFRLSRRWIAVCSLGFGLVSGATIGGGILVLPILAGAGLAGAAFVATDAIIGMVLHVVKMIIFGTASVLTAQQFILGLVIGIMMIPGAYVARWLIRRMPVSVHTGLIDAVIVMGGIGFLMQAYRSINS
ncbi:MAG: sulfite exporter TauE/SafE family protein [Beijerinckiaceae bacterium]